MKRLMLVFVILLSVCIIGCSDKNSYHISGQYIMESEKSEKVFLPRILFDDKDKAFIVEYDILASTAMGGTYKIKKDKIFAETSDGKIYVFNIVDDHIIMFEQNNSSRFNLTNEEVGTMIENEAVFKKVQ